MRQRGQTSFFISEISPLNLFARPSKNFYRYNKILSLVIRLLRRKSSSYILFLFVKLLMIANTLFILCCWSVTMTGSLPFDFDFFLSSIFFRILQVCKYSWRVCFSSHHKILKCLYFDTEAAFLLLDLRTKDVKFGIISIVKKTQVTIQSMTAMLKSALKMEEREVIFVQENSKFLQPYHKISLKRQKGSSTKLIQLQYSQQEILG